MIQTDENGVDIYVLGIDTVRNLPNLNYFDACFSYVI